MLALFQKAFNGAAQSGTAAVQYRPTNTSTTLSQVLQPPGGGAYGIDAVSPFKYIYV